MKKIIFMILILSLFLGCTFEVEVTPKTKTGSYDYANYAETDISINNLHSKETIKNEIKTVSRSKKKIRRAMLNIDRVQVQVANLYPTRVTVSNTGDVTIYPKFDFYVYDRFNNEVCSGSPMFDEFSGIPAGYKKTGELTTIGCIFEKDGTYTLRIDLLDDDYARLDSKSKQFTVNYWGKFDFDFDDYYDDFDQYQYNDYWDTLPPSIPTSLPEQNNYPPTQETNNEVNTQIVGVPANTEWQNTGININGGDKIIITADGNVKIAGSDSHGYDPDGVVETTASDVAKLLCPSTNRQYALVGKIGSGDCFYIGSSKTFTAENSGQFYLSVNDRKGLFGDNSGSWTVEVKIE